MIQKNTNCRSCGSNNFQRILDFGNQPLAGDFLLNNDDLIINEEKYPLEIYFCEDCGLLQVPYDFNPEKLFKQCNFSSSTIEHLIEHFKAYAQWIKENLQPNVVLEFGCNDGILLKELQQLQIAAVGLDISSNMSQLARDKGLNVLTKIFDRNSANELLSQLGAVDMVIGSNCFPHNNNLHEILLATKTILKYEGLLSLEFMYAGDLLDKNQWDSMYHEHLNYFSLYSLEKLLAMNDFRVVDAIRIPTHGGSLRVVATRSPSILEKNSVANLRDYEYANHLAKLSTWQKFAKNVHKQISVTREVLSRLSKNAKLSAYGASGRASMWLNLCNMNYLDCIADSSPYRSGKLIPGIHTPIVSPELLQEFSPDYIFVPAWNYINEIVAKEKWYKGNWCIPVPTLQFI